MKLNDKQNELYKRTDEVLHYIWDPIGVSEEPYARDEYHSYLPQVFAKLLKPTTKEEIIDYLVGIEKDQMEIDIKKDHAAKVVEILFDYRDKIFEEENDNNV